MRAFWANGAAAVIALLFSQGAPAQFWPDSTARKIARELEDTRSELEQCPAVAGGQHVAHVGFHSGFAPAADSARWVQVDLGMERSVDSVVVIPACLDGSGAHGFPSRFRIETSTDSLFSEPELLVDAEVEDSASILPYFFPAQGRRARFVRFTAAKLVPQPRLNSRFIFCLGELLVFSAGRNVALRGAVLAPNSVETLPTWSPKHLVDGSYALGIPARPDVSAGNGWHSRIFARPDSESHVQVDLGAPRVLDEIRLIPAHPEDYPDRPGFGFPNRFKLEVSLSEDFSDARTVFDARHADFASPGNTKVAFAAGGVSARYIRLTALRLWERSSDFVFALSELEAYEGGRNVARQAVVTASDSTVTARWKPEFLVDGIGGAGLLQEEEEWLAGLSRRRVLLARKEGLLTRQAEMGRMAQERTKTFAVGFVVAAAGAAGLLVWRGRFVRARAMEVLRQQISRDLHDEIGSNLCSIRLMAELSSAGGVPGRVPDEVLAEIRQLAEAGTESLRDMVWLLKEGGRPKIGVLVEKMRSVAASLLPHIRWSLETGATPGEAAAPLSFHRDVLFIFREALHNVVKHSGADSVAIELGWTGREVTLSVADNGRGFHPGEGAEGEGIENMRHRAAQLSGTLRLESSPAGGARLILKAPMP